MRSRRNRRRGKSGSFGIWILAGLVFVFGGLRLIEGKMTDKNWDIGRSYIDNMIGDFVFSSDEGQGEENTSGKTLVSRGKMESREAAGDTVGILAEGTGDSGIPWLLEGFLDSALPGTGQITLAEGEGISEKTDIVLSQEGLSGQTGESTSSVAESGTLSTAAGGNPPQPVGEAEGEGESVPVPQSVSNPNVVSSSIIDGAVLIYHTHSTESYEPYSDGNYHSVPETGTVREVGTHLAERLKGKGITVYHDQTLHDSPSYNSSYSRSLDTLQRQLSERPEIQVVIDLHRDASASGKKYATTTVNGKTASSFNIVVGNKNKNYQQLLAFAQIFLEKANELYPGLGGRIIEREYKFNGYMSDHALLLEVGNNLNTIDEVNVTGDALGDVVEAVMRDF